MNGEKYVLKLKVAGKTKNPNNAIDNIDNYCDEHLHDGFTLEHADLKEKPELAASEQIITVSALIRKIGGTARIPAGDCSNKEKVLMGLNIKPA